MLKSLGCFHLVNFVIVHFGNHSAFLQLQRIPLYGWASGYFFSLPLWASMMLLIYCHYNRHTRNTRSAGVRLFVSFPLKPFSLLLCMIPCFPVFPETSLVVPLVSFAKSSSSTLSPEYQSYLRLAPRISLLFTLLPRYAHSFQGLKTIYMLMIAQILNPTKPHLWTLVPSWYPPSHLL